MKRGWRGQATGIALILGGLILLNACEWQSAGPNAEQIAMNNRGVAQMGHFDYAAAQQTFAALIEKYPEWTDARVNLAIAMLNRQHEGDEAAALAIVDQVLADEPGHVRADYVAGLLRLYLGETAAALSHFRRVTEADPKDAYAAYYLGQVLLQVSQPDKALVWYQKAMELDPYLRSAYYSSALVLRRTGDREQATRMLSDYQRFKDNPRARLAEFKYTRMGPKAEAIALGDIADSETTEPAGPVFADAVEHLDSLPVGELSSADIDQDGQQVLDTRGQPAFSRGPFKFNQGDPEATARLSPGWWPWKDREEKLRLNRAVDAQTVQQIADAHDAIATDVLGAIDGPMHHDLKRHWPRFLLGTDTLGRSLAVRCRTGGGISLTIGLAAALLSVFIGTVYGSLAAYAGGKVDAVMMRIVDILFGLPYILLVVLLAVASDAVLDEHISREKTRHRWVQSTVVSLLMSAPGSATRDDVRAFLSLQFEPSARFQELALDALTTEWERHKEQREEIPRRPVGADADTWLSGFETNREVLAAAASLTYPPRKISEGRRTTYDVLVLLLAIGGVSWLTMARVIRGQV
ncbi:MAG: tetratricopeptide repeat protein, partial [Proteobacteria bacterium]|nr:tetratricopeptide repeat protein [Pseudomonadota bacterium]